MKYTIYNNDILTDKGFLELGKEFTHRQRDELKDDITDKEIVRKVTELRLNYSTEEILSKIRKGEITFE